MKVRESGMPDELVWNGFFDIELILSEMQINSDVDDLVEIGFGYGTFTTPSVKKIKGKVYAFDIEKEMFDYLKQKLKKDFVENVVLEHRDILEHSTGLKDNSIDYIMLFNILHNDSPDDFFKEAHRILRPGGKIGIIHWRSDISTPRGPDLNIRPKPEDIIKLIDNEKFELSKAPFNIAPYHYGLIISKQ